MKKLNLQLGMICCLALVLQGCATGYNRSLVINKSNIGMDFDSAPSKLETSISSTSGVVTPTFEGGQVLPIMSNISSSSNNFSKFFSGSSSTLTTGSAAYTMSYYYADCNKDVAPITEIPDVKLTKKPKAVPGPGEVRPAVFMSNTVLGMKLGLATNAPLSPSSINLGFNRKEEISTPITVRPDKNNPGHMIANTPSSIISVDHWNDIKNGRKATANTKHVKSSQYFALGKAADNLAMRSDVRSAVFKRLTPDMKDSFCEEDFETKQLGRR